jgi:hypothetical protein
MESRSVDGAVFGGRNRWEALGRLLLDGEVSCHWRAEASEQRGAPVRMLQ